jgi:DnaK suppressor protein
VTDETKLATLREELVRQRDDLRREIEEHGADPETDEVTFEGDAGFSDRSHSVVRALRSNLHDVELAIDKIDAGTYGACERCGNPIGAERLEAIPWALLCIDCKRKAG